MKHFPAPQEPAMPNLIRSPLFVAMVLITSLVLTLVACMNLSNAYASGDAGPAIVVVDAGPEVVMDAGPAPAVAKDFPDAPQDPAKIITVTKEVYDEMGLMAAITFALFALGTAAGRRAGPGTWLGDAWGGRMGATLGAIATTMGAMGAAMAGEITWTAAIAALLMAVATLLNPVPKPTA